MKLFVRCYCLEVFVSNGSCSVRLFHQFACLINVELRQNIQTKWSKLACIHHAIVVGWNTWERGLGYQSVYYYQHLYITQFHPFKSPVTLLCKCKEVRILNVLIYTFCPAWLLGHIHGSSIKIYQIFNELLF